MKLAVLGASGMLGHAVLRLFAKSPGYDVVGAVRSPGAFRHLPDDISSRLVSGIDAENLDSVMRFLESERPEAVVNCIGLIKQLAGAKDYAAAISMNALLPHRLARLCGLVGARFVHMSTDCVFSGRRGLYGEDNFADADDLYGRSKLLGEVDYSHAVTLRTSIIGPELNSANGLVGWFLSQQGAVQGFRRAVFSGLPTVELARVIRDFVLSNPDLRGVWHVSADPINKYELLLLVREAYGRSIEVHANDDLVIDRSLNSQRFRDKTGYFPQPWPELIRSMRDFG